jgi:hypothetical protein
MRILQLEESHRAWLNSKGALEVDGNLDEKFVGLTHVESVVYAARTTPPIRPLDLWSADELIEILDLHARHELILAVKVIRYGVTFH